MACFDVFLRTLFEIPSVQARLRELYSLNSIFRSTVSRNFIKNTRLKTTEVKYNLFKDGPSMQTIREGRALNAAKGLAPL